MQYCNHEISPTKEVIDLNGIRYIKRYALEVDYSCKKCKDYFNCKFLNILDQREMEYREHRPQPRLTPMEEKQLEKDDVKRFRKK